MSQTGIDIAWDRPTVAAILATGAHWVARYFSPDPTKNLTAAEVHDYTAAGLGVVTVWEGSATRALAGRAAGVADAQAAEQQRIAVGLPSDMVIHFAVDTDTDWASVAPYFNGVISVLGLARTGTYGGLRVIEGAHAAGIKYLWQTVAWSGGVWSQYATIRQPIGTTLGGNADYDTAEVTDFGQYPRPSEDIVLDAATLAQLKAMVVDATWNHTEINATDGKTPVRMGAVMAWMDRVHAGQVSSLTAQIGALTAVVSALSKQGGLTAEQATAAAQAGADAALAEAEAAAKRVVDALQPPAAPAKP